MFSRETYSNTTSPNTAPQVNRAQSTAPLTSQPKPAATTTSSNGTPRSQPASNTSSGASSNSNRPVPQNNKSIYKLVIVGGGGVGKSAITIQFIQGLFVEEYDPTIEDSYRKPCSVDGLSTVIDLLDTAGQEEYASMRDTYIRGGEGFLLTYAINSMGSFEEIHNYQKHILRIKDSDHYPIVLIGNKSDLPADQRVITEEAGRNTAKEWKVPFFETSALMKKNIEESFFEAVREIRRADANATSNKISKPGKTPKAQKGCVLL